MGLLMALVLALGALVVLTRWQVVLREDISPGWLGSVWCIRIAAGFCLMAIYTWYYPDRNTGDTWKYFDDAMKIRSWWSQDPSLTLRFLTGIGLDDPAFTLWKDQLTGWNTQYTYGLPYDYRMMVRLQLLLSILSFGHYEVHVVLMALAGWWGSWFAFRAIRPFWPHAPLSLFLLLNLIPTTALWSSGVAKESPLWLGFGLALLVTSEGIRNRFGRQHIVPALFAAALLSAFKPYIGLCMVPSLFSLIIWHLVHRKRLALVFVSVHALIILAATTGSWLNPAGDLFYILEKRRDDFYAEATNKHARSVVAIPQITNFAEAVMHLPEAMALTYLRPWPGEAENATTAAAATENGLLALLLALVIPAFRWPRNTDQPFLWFAVSFVVANAVIIGFSVPVLGASVRYKMAGLMMLIILTGILARGPQRRILIKLFCVLKGPDAATQDVRSSPAE